MSLITAWKRGWECAQMERWILELQRSTACSRAEAWWVLKQGIHDRCGRRLCTDQFTPQARLQMEATIGEFPKPRDELDVTIMRQRQLLFSEMIAAANGLPPPEPEPSKATPEQQETIRQLIAEVYAEREAGKGRR